MQPGRPPQFQHPQYLQAHQVPPRLPPQQGMTFPPYAPPHQMPPRFFPPPMCPPRLAPPMQQVVSAPPTMLSSSGVPVTPYIPPRPINTGPAYYPMTLFIGNLPQEMSDEFLKKILECCGAIQKWNRPKDPFTDEFKSFAICTFREGRFALRCKRVLNDFELPVQPAVVGDNTRRFKLVVSGGSREEALLATLAAQERAKFSNNSGENISATLGEDRADGGDNEEANIESQLDAPVRQNVCAVMEGQVNDDVSDENKQETENNNQNPERPQPYMLREGDEGYDREKEIQSEIEQYRWRQFIRDREVAIERKERLQKRLKELEEQLKSEKAGATKEKDQGKLSDASKRIRDGHITNYGDAGDNEIKRQRKEQVMDFVRSTQEQSQADQNIIPHLTTTKIVLKSSATSNKPKMARPTGGFAITDDDEQEGNKLRELIPLDYTAEEEAQGHLAALQQISNASVMGNAKHTNVVTKQVAVAPSTEQQDKLKALADAVPTKKDELFVYPIKWSALDQHNVVDLTIKPWVVKKFIEFLGEEEESITTFIVSKLKQHCKPQELLDELFPVLDSDAESFVLKLWRLVAFSSLKADMTAL